MLDTRFSETVLPEDDRIADALLAACLQDREAAERAVELLTPEDFPDGRLRPYRPIFEAIATLVRKGKRPAPPLVGEQMRRAGFPLSAYSDALSALAQSYTGGVPVDDYAHILIRYTIRRNLRQAGLDLMNLSNDDSLETVEYTPKAEAIISKATERGINSDEPRLVGEIIRGQLDIHKARKKGEIDGLKIGFPEVDSILFGLRPGDMVIIAARPSMGKTAFAQNIADNMATTGKKVLFVSAEQPAEQIADRIIASEGKVAGKALRGGFVDERQWESVEWNLSKSGIMEAEYRIDDTSVTVAEIRAKALRLQRQYGLDCILIDYLQQLRAGNRYRGNKVQEVAEISADTKRLAKELKVPVIILSQLSRDLERREDKRPMLSDLRDSGAIEQDADVVMFIYRDNYYKPESSDKTTEIIVAKNRNGSIGTARLVFIPERTRFESMDNRHG